MTRTDYCAAWKKWDEVMLAMPRHPSATYGKTVTDRLVLADREVARSIDAKPHVLHDRLTAARREGLSYEQAFDAVVGA